MLPFKTDDRPSQFAARLDFRDLDVGLFPLGEFFLGGLFDLGSKQRANRLPGYGYPAIERLDAFKFSDPVISVDRRLRKAQDSRPLRDCRALRPLRDCCCCFTRCLNYSGDYRIAKLSFVKPVQAQSRAKPYCN